MPPIFFVLPVFCENIYTFLRNYLCFFQITVFFDTFKPFISHKMNLDVRYIFQV